ncbi:MAG: DUF4037 domain-containing protein [Oscillospiraceae bacterium]|nr:DUF4037 domain-containing protein [Oscillospiraceae bacterium]
MEQKIQTLVELLKETVEGKCAIALAGAHAKGMADAASDIDLYVFAERAKPREQRLELIRGIADPGTTPWVDDFDAAPWGGGMDFTYKCTPVEVAGRTLARMDQVVGACLEGKFEIIPATWTSNGYYTFIYLCELSFIKPVWDPDGILAAYQQKAAVYPEPLRRAILETFMGRAGTWIGNFHYESAVRRGDILFTAPIVLHTVMDMVQVVFALNRIYFTGDKKLEAALEKMPYCPEALRPSQLDVLLTAARDTAQLERQRKLLKDAWEELSQWVREA